MNTGESIFDKWFKNKDFHKQQSAYIDFQKCLENWEPRSDIRALDYGINPPVILSAVPGLAICTKILTANRFNLWGPGKLMVSLVTGIVPSVMTVGGHEWIKRDVLLGLTKCSVCLETKAVATQMCTGIILPTMLGLAVANHNLVGNSWKKELFRGWCITKKDFLKCSNIMIGNAILQALVVSVILYYQVDEWHNVRVQLQRRKDIDESRPKPPSKIITTVPNSLR